jgi:hypothetical protein
VASGNKTVRRLWGTLGWLALFACVLLAPGAAFADTLQWGGVNGVAYGGYYVSPYYATNLTPDPDEQLVLYCLDFNHWASTTQWQANINTLGENQSQYQYTSNDPSPDFAYDFTGLDTVLKRYLAAAWLFGQELNTKDSRTLGVNQYAAWKLFVDVEHDEEYDAALAEITISDSNFAADVQKALEGALANFSTVNASAWRVVSPDPARQPSSKQEFLTPVTESSGLLALLAVMVIALGAELRRARLAR